MLESEAKTKWCPMARNASGPKSCNRNSDDEPTALCIGSECMVWQWHTGGGNTERAKELSLAKINSLPRDQRHGRCGLAR